LLWSQVYRLEVNSVNRLLNATSEELYWIRDSSHLFLEFSVELSPYVDMLIRVNLVEGSHVPYRDGAVSAVVAVGESVGPRDVFIFLSA
jgi:hypothetical protein